jgi:AAA ATPase domain
MADPPVVFTDREEELAAVAGLLDPGSRQRVLVVHGAPGLGKSTLLAHIYRTGDRRWRRVLIDVEGMVTPAHAVPEEGGEDLALRLLRELGLALAGTAPWWRRRRARRRARAIGREAGQSGPVQVEMRAWDHSQIEGTRIDAGEQTQAGRRARWVDDLLAVAASARRRCLLLVDTAEWLYFFDEVARDRPRPDRPLGVGGWFAGAVLAPLLDAAPRLRVVLAGRDAVAVGKLPAGAHQLDPWQARHTASYLAALGIADPGLAEAVHDECHGLPVVAAWLAEECLDQRDRGGAADRRWLAAVARDRPLRAWLPERFFGRLTAAESQLTCAAAVLRAITLGAMEAMLPGLPAG